MSAIIDNVCSGKFSLTFLYMKLYTAAKFESIFIYKYANHFFLIISRILMQNPYQSFDLIKMKESVFKLHALSRC